MGKRTVLGRFIGPPDETLKQIGMVIVMAARLDYQRMQILERTAGVPVEESANLRRRTLTRRLKDSVRREPLNRLEIKLNEWLREVNDLTGHPRLARPLRDVPPGLGRWSQGPFHDASQDGAGAPCVHLREAGTRGGPPGRRGPRWLASHDGLGNPRARRGRV